MKTIRPFALLAAMLVCAGCPAGKDAQESAKSFKARGDTKKDKGNLDGAISDFSEAIALDPKFTDAYISRGVAKFDKGDMDGAISDYNHAIELDPKDAFPYNNRGTAKKPRGITAGQWLISLAPLSSIPN